MWIKTGITRTRLGDTYIDLEKAWSIRVVPFEGEDERGKRVDIWKVVALYAYDEITISIWDSAEEANDVAAQIISDMTGALTKTYRDYQPTRRPAGAL